MDNKEQKKLMLLFFWRRIGNKIEKNLFLMADIYFKGI